MPRKFCLGFNSHLIHLKIGVQFQSVTFNTENLKITMKYLQHLLRDEISLEKKEIMMHLPVVYITEEGTNPHEDEFCWDEIHHLVIVCNHVTVAVT